MAGENSLASNNRTLGTSRRIAREARRRIDLVASRLTGRGVLLKLVAEKPAPADRVVVISDTHFGDQQEVLTSERAIDVLADTIQGMGRVDELVLLGDMFDFWRAPVTDCLARSRDFFACLLTLDNVGRIVYLPGNHDHHVFRLYYQEEESRRLREGNLEPPHLSIPLTRDCPVFEAIRPEKATVPLYMTYPFHQLSVSENNVLFTHGHLLGFFERSFWRPKHAVLGSLLLNKKESLGLEDMEKLLSPYYEMITLSAEVPGVVAGSYRVYRILARTGRALGLQGADRVSAKRDTSIEENAVEVEALLDHFCPEKPDYFIFGHTHRSGMLRLPISGVTAINSGCWLDDRSDAGARNTIVEITDKARLVQVEV